MKKVKAKDLKPGMVVLGHENNPSAWEQWGGHVVKSVKRINSRTVDLLAHDGAHEQMPADMVYVVR